MNEVISLNNVTFGYEKETVLEKLDMKVYQGDLIGIMGVNGAGKSTLIKLILGQLEPWQGSVMMNGKKVSKYNIQNGIGYVPQRASGKGSGFPATASEIVMLNLFREIGFLKRPKKYHHQMVHNALKMVEMEDYADRLIYKMSGGQQQRIMIAKALVNNPDILLLDEPTTGIDRQSTQQLMHLLHHLNYHHKITILVISHDASVLRDISSRIFLLDNKQAIERIGEE